MGKVQRSTDFKQQEWCEMVVCCFIERFTLAEIVGLSLLMNSRGCDGRAQVPARAVAAIGRD
jgi:hypothetical protein